MSDTSSDLVTTYTFKSGKEYLVKMKISSSKGFQRCLELTITDKYTAEYWQSSYDTPYIENLTHKTGNYKQFDVFLTMLRSGLLKTSESIALDLLTLDDLELLRARKVEGSAYSEFRSKGNNRRYLILTYTVEFDRIHYPLPLEYCGLPDPIVLQATIRRLETELERSRINGSHSHLRRRVKQLTETNRQLSEEIRLLSSGGSRVPRLLDVIKTLEQSVTNERAAFRKQIQKLRSENVALNLKIRRLTEPASQMISDGSPVRKLRSRPLSRNTRQSRGRNGRSSSPSITTPFVNSSSSAGILQAVPICNCDTTFYKVAHDTRRTRRQNMLQDYDITDDTTLNACSSNETIKSKRSSRGKTIKSRRADKRDSMTDFENLESRIHTLQKMLKEGINLS